MKKLSEELREHNANVLKRGDVSQLIAVPVGLDLFKRIDELEQRPNRAAASARKFAELKDLIKELMHGLEELEELEP